MKKIKTLLRYYLIFGVLLSISPTKTIAQTCTADSLVLVTLFNSTNGNNWVTTWDLSQPMNTWYGVYVNSEGCVTCLDLDGNNSCTNQPEMGGNNLTGTLPVEIGQLSSLEKLYLGENLMVGDIPTEISNLNNLIHLVLTNNDFTGTIPVEIMDMVGLEILSLAENNLTGTIPVEIGNLVNLTMLGLSYNQLTGGIPSEVGNLTNLTLLFLHHNQLTGSIPASLSNLINLTSLGAYDNQLSGCFPNELSSLCTVGNVGFYNNPMLPGGGDFAAFCMDGTGGCDMVNGVNSILSEKEKIEIYPNPTRQILVLENEKYTRDIQIDLWNALGQKVSTFNLEGKIEVDVSGFKRGVYWLSSEGYFLERVVLF